MRMPEKSSTFAGVIENKVNTMARPIKETPTLYGEDARKGERYFSNYAIAGCAITGTKYATIGLLLCRTKDKIKAEYALRDINKPIGVSDYELGNMLPKDLRSSLPSIEDIEKELDN